MATAPDTSNWDTAKVRAMHNMFYYCTSMATAPDTTNWDTSLVVTMDRMFYNCDGFETIDLTGLDFPLVADMANFLGATYIDVASYDGLLNTIAGQAPNIQSNVTLDGGTSKYSTNAVTARATLTNTNTYNWTINDGGLE